MAPSEDKFPVTPPRPAWRVTAAIAVAAASCLLLAGCGSAKHTGAEDVHIQNAVKTQIRKDAARQNVKISELACLSINTTKLTCLVHVANPKAPEEATATIIASVENGARASGKHPVLLEGPAAILGHS